MKMRPRWYMLLRDMRQHLTRSVLVVLSIAIGVFAIGTVAHTRLLLSQSLHAGYASVRPASAVLYTSDLDDRTVHEVRQMKEVREAEARRAVAVRVKAEAGEWREMEIAAIPRFDDIRVNLVRPESGAWPPARGELLMEHASMSALGVKAGERIQVKTPDGQTLSLRVAGRVRDLGQIPPGLSGKLYGYCSFATLKDLREPGKYNRLYITVSERATDRKHIQRVAALVRDRILEKAGTTVYRTKIPEPGKHPLHDVTETLITILIVLGGFILALSGLLVINTMSALLTERLRLIGILKAIGGRVGQIALLYLGWVFLYGLSALIMAMPLSAFASDVLMHYLADLLNFEVIGFRMPVSVILTEVGMAILVPAVAALIPILVKTRIPAREALAAGTGQTGGQIGKTGSRISRIPGVARPVLMSLRNTFRRKVRLVLMLAMLTLAGALFISVWNVRSSLLATYDGMSRYWLYDVEVRLAEPASARKTEQLVRSLPGVERTEMWVVRDAFYLRPDGSENENIYVIAPSPDSDMIRPTLLRGRLPHPDERQAVAVNADFLKEEQGVKVGDTIVLKTEGHTTRWKVVGVVSGQLMGPVLYTTAPALAEALGDPERANFVVVRSSRHAAEDQEQLAKKLEERLQQAGLKVVSTDTHSGKRSRTQFYFDIVVAFLLVMTLLLAGVGSLGLTGTMSINVLERTREIGIMRAMGATGGKVYRIFITEGIVIGWLSALLGAILALPLTRVLGNAVGNALLFQPLDLRWTPEGFGIWLVAAVMLSACATLLPARKASRLPVRDVLLYE